ncbi:hypothetical protein QYF50_15435 [Paenibacillus vini]|uniref:hypothetical protein n=1 Tax=Paenibacillus vini TaxID=1476024 RepID=UPI0025B6672F|nr:hypothetical protein [Paenibacillus vini]MDN4069244.1 hypothetical protein [Paenibacillus vini]MDN4069297.1 hypothetical protein [Paenibacillus vini]
MSPTRIREPESDMVHLSKVSGEFLQYFMMNEEQRRLYWLNIVQERRYLAQRNPLNEMNIYELCKAVSKLSEIDGVDFVGSSIGEKIRFIRQLAPNTSSQALVYGVEEYHDSQVRQNGAFHEMTACEMDKIGDRV